MAIYEEEKNFFPMFRTAIALMQVRDFDKYCNLIQQAKIRVCNTDFDNWNGGTYGYTVYLYIPVKLYAPLSKEEIEEAEMVFAESLNEATKDSDNQYFNVKIVPFFSKSDIKWEDIGGDGSKEQLRKDLESLKELMILVATGEEQIQNVDAKYKELHNSINSRCKKLNLKYENHFDNLWDWYSKWRNDFPHYKERRQFINQLFAPSLDAFISEEASPLIATPVIDLSDWDNIKRILTKIQRDSSKAINEEDFQQIGFLCREVIISLAQAVYNPDYCGSKDENGIKISKTDAVRMIGSYINERFAGAPNEEMRAYAKATNKLTNYLTHKRNAEKQDMLLCVSATMALINFIGILENKISF